MLELAGSDAQTVTFSDASTLKLDGSSNFTGTVTGLAIGDIIDLASTEATTVVFDGSKLTINGTPTTFTISGLPNTDTFYFTSDGPSGTDFTVEAAPTVTINTIAGDNVINASEAASGFTISGTASDSSVDVDGQTITVHIIDSSDTVVDSFTATVSGGNWSGCVTASEAQALADGNYTVTANLTDWAGNPAPEASQTLTVHEAVPVITIAAPATATIGVNQTDPIPGISLSESGNTAGETFTVTLSDTNGVLSATGGTWSSGNDTLTISGKLTKVNSDLARCRTPTARRGPTPSR